MVEIALPETQGGGKKISLAELSEEYSGYSFDPASP